jgi:ubiquinone/menaquinone biosynthesis C-methylase UbiE
MGARIPQEAYGRDFFLSPFLEGYEAYQQGGLSVVKARQLEMLALDGRSTFLEVGYGRGELLLHCARKGAKVAGVDYAVEAHRLARETLREHPEVDLRVADGRRLPFGSNTFDRVFSGDVIEHMCFEDGVEMLREMYRVTRPGGLILVHTTPNTVFTRWVYPLVRPLLLAINLAGVKNIDAHLGIMRRFHIDEYNFFTLRRAARRAGLAGARVWIDPDLTRSDRHRLTRPFSRNILVRAAGRCGRFWLARFLLGNDLYLRCQKVPDPATPPDERCVARPAGLERDGPAEGSRETEHGRSRCSPTAAGSRDQAAGTIGSRQ